MRIIDKQAYLQELISKNPNKLEIIEKYQNKVEDTDEFEILLSNRPSDEKVRKLQKVLSPFQFVEEDINCHVGNIEFSGNMVSFTINVFKAGKRLNIDEKIQIINPPMRTILSEMEDIEVTSHLGAKEVRQINKSEYNPIEAIKQLILQNIKKQIKDGTADSLSRRTHRDING